MIAHDRRQPTRLSLSLKASILVDGSSSFGCQSRHFVTAAYEGARIDHHDTRDTSSGLLVKNKIGFVSQNVPVGSHRFCLGDFPCVEPDKGASDVSGGGS
jgi:hypothetical protein